MYPGTLAALRERDQRRGGFESAFGAYLLAHVDLLLELEDVLDEEVVQRFVGEVDAQLREGVDREILKAEDVEDTDGKVA